MKTIYTFAFLMLMVAFANAQCIITSLNVTVGGCQSTSDTYDVNGDVSFSNEPTTGTLVVSLDDGVTVYDTVINPPFVSPLNYSISNMASNGNVTTVSAVFTDDLTCTISVNSNSPASCACIADVGTFTIGSNLFSNNTHYIAYGDDFTMTSNLDHTFANEVNTGFGPSYDTSMAYLAFSCVSTTPGAPYSDPCLLGIVGYDSLRINCDGNSLLSNPYYVQAITMYSGSANVYSHTTDPNQPCFDLGLVQEVYCLSPILPIVTSDPGTGEITVTISGGMPAEDGSLFTISNVLPAGANGGVTTVVQNGNIVLSGLLNGDQYALTITDDAGGEAVVSNMYNFVDEGSSLPLSFYPNPVNDQLFIKGITEETNVRVSTIDGAVVLLATFSQNDKISTTDWASGIYIVTCKSANGIISRKIVK